MHSCILLLAIRTAFSQAMQRSQGQVEWMQTAAQLRELSRNQDLTSQLKFRVVMMGRMEDLHVDLHASDVLLT